MKKLTHAQWFVNNRMRELITKREEAIEIIESHIKKALKDNNPDYTIKIFHESFRISEVRDYIKSEYEKLKWDFKYESSPCFIYLTPQQDCITCPVASPG